MLGAQGKFNKDVKYPGSEKLPLYEEQLAGKRFQVVCIAGSLRSSFLEVGEERNKTKNLKESWTFVLLPLLTYE